MKKIIALLLVILTCCSMFALTSCEHTHSYGSWVVTKPATCTESGEKAKSCSCDDVITDTVPATGHKVVNGVCTNCNTIISKCDGCFKSVNGVYQEIEIMGVTIYYCDECYEEYEEAMDALEDLM